MVPAIPRTKRPDLVKVSDYTVRLIILDPRPAGEVAQDYGVSVGSVNRYRRGGERRAIRIRHELKDQGLLP